MSYSIKLPYRLLLFLIIIYIPINLLKDLFPFPLTLITGGAILLNLLYINLQSVKGNVFFSFMITILIFAMNSFVTDDISTHIRYFMNWLGLLFVLAFLSDKKKSDILFSVFEENIRFYKKLNIICWIIMVILLLNPSCYSGGWWGLSGGFVAFTVSHGVAAAACTLGVLSVLVWNDVKHIMFLFVPLLASAYIILQTGARTYVISIGIFILYYVYSMIKQPYLRMLILITVIIFGLLVIPKSSFAEKNDIVMNYNSGKTLNSLSSGRIEIWLTDILYFLNNGIYLLIFGNGFATSFFVNRTYYYDRSIFSHNMFIETLLSMGIIGFIILIYFIYKCMKNTCPSSKDNKEKILLGVYLILVGFINGMIDSQMYCYSVLFVVLIIKNNKCEVDIQK